jgi:Tfp pilus assembly protein PilE
VLVGVAIPIYDKQVLKGRFEEAKVTIQAIALAQERYKIETGSYYPSSAGEVKNENVIASNLKVVLNESSNFNYIVNTKTDNGGNQSYIIKAVLRGYEKTDGRIVKPGLCRNSTSTTICKQAGSSDPDDWAKKYTIDEEHHYITMTYPTTATNLESGIDYANIYTE